MLNDIANRNDIEKLVDEFYKKVQANELLAPVFIHVDWPQHLPNIYNFWSSVIFGDQNYRGNPFQKHIDLPIGKEHFVQWLKLFIKTVDVNFAGSNAEEIKVRAKNIAVIFQHRMGLLQIP